MNNNLLHQVALTLVPKIGPVQARTLVDHFGNAAAVFKAKKSSLESLEGIGAIRARSIKDFAAFKKAEEELIFIEKYKITPLFIGDDLYPKRLINCYDPPTMLYYRGKANLNASKIITIVGDLQAYQPLIISGLALGVDAIAHKAALKYNVPAVAVIAHGLIKFTRQNIPCLQKILLKKMAGCLQNSGANQNRINIISLPGTALLPA